MDFTGADLTDAFLRAAVLDGVEFSGVARPWTDFNGVDMSKVIAYPPPATAVCSVNLRTPRLPVSAQ